MNILLSMFLVDANLLPDDPKQVRVYPICLGRGESGQEKAETLASVLVIV